MFIVLKLEIFTQTLQHVCYEIRYRKISIIGLSPFFDAYTL